MVVPFSCILCPYQFYSMVSANHVNQIHEDWEKQVDDDDDDDKNIRGLKTGQCQSCGKRETGYHCHVCKMCVVTCVTKWKVMTLDTLGQARTGVSLSQVTLNYVN